VALSPREFSLLACFARHPGEALSRDRLLAEAWGYEHDPGTNVVDVYVGYLRRKLGDPKAIETVRSTGYRLAAGEPR
jgi:DNA-binding response OmpR family regulator